MIAGARAAGLARPRPLGPWLALSGAVLLLLGCAQDRALEALADGGKARAVAAVSGDALAIDAGRTVKLAGITAPAPGQPYGVEARAALQGVGAGRTVRLSYGGAAEGPYHLRDAATRRWLQQALLETGAARVRTIAGGPGLVREMLRIEARARQAGRGLWALPAYQVRLPHEVVATRADGFQVVEGRVVRAAEAGGRLFLEFSSQWRGGFSTETPLAETSGFSAAGVDLPSLAGKLVRVRGEVRSTSFGPRLRLDHPEQLERLKEPDD